jgi:hypothetical protein
VGVAGSDVGLGGSVGVAVGGAVVGIGDGADTGPSGDEATAEQPTAIRVINATAIQTFFMTMLSS